MKNKTLTEYVPYKVKDLSLAEWGRKEIKLAEAEMPGLMVLRERLKKEVTAASKSIPSVSKTHITS